MTRYVPPPLPQSVIARIAGLPDLPMDELKTLWQRLFGSGTPTHNRRFLERRIAFKLQEIEFRKQAPALLERNQRRITALIETGKLRQRDRDVRPAAGTVLTREYRGVVHRVIATTDGHYEYQGRPYPSLSKIAREITGTQWSGPVFFGLKTASPKPAQGKGGHR